MIYAMFTLAMLTVLIGLITAKVRIDSVKRGLINAKYFKLMQGQSIPDVIVKTTRCFNNLFEVPILFYVVCSLSINLAIDSIISLIFAWLFVLCRCVQAYIHMTYNNAMHRMFTFAASVFCVLLLWINLVIQQL